MDGIFKALASVIEKTGNPWLLALLIVLSFFTLIIWIGGQKPREIISLMCELCFGVALSVWIVNRKKSAKKKRFFKKVSKTKDQTMLNILNIVLPQPTGAKRFSNPEREKMMPKLNLPTFLNIIKMKGEIIQKHGIGKVAYYPVTVKNMNPYVVIEIFPDIQAEMLHTPSITKNIREKSIKIIK